MAGGAILLPGGTLAVWLTVPLALCATLLLLAPAAAALSALFPRTVDLNSIGRKSNAHGAATFLGMLVCGFAGGAAGTLVLIANRLLDRGSLAPVLMLAWCALCFVLARLLFVPVRRLLASRRENLAQLRA
jgi:hypothetical protein